MPPRDEIKAALAQHITQGTELLGKFVKPEKEEKLSFHFEYQKWYSKDLPVVR